MIRITFSGKTLDETLAQIQAAGIAAGSQLAQRTAGEAKLTTEAPVETTKRGRKPKDLTPTTQEPVKQDAAATMTATDTAPAAQALENIPKKQISEQLQKVAEKGGMPLVKTTLGKFGANRVGDLPVAKYKEFLDECAKVLA